MLPVAKQVVFSRSCLGFPSSHRKLILGAPTLLFSLVNIKNRRNAFYNSSNLLIRLKIDQSQLEVEPQRLECLRTVLPVQSLIHPADVIVEISGRKRMEAEVLITDKDKKNWRRATKEKRHDQIQIDTADNNCSGRRYKLKPITGIGGRCCTVLFSGIMSSDSLSIGSSNG
ncbi:hypothetical protein NC652_021974 [Populus alba x Populus x berolinensis]|nr:hypothetical protein NC652_021974 [Populus alba x Populus x berolinensis]